MHGRPCDSLGVSRSADCTYSYRRGIECVVDSRPKAQEESRIEKLVHNPTGHRWPSPTYDQVSPSTLGRPVSKAYHTLTRPEDGVFECAELQDAARQRLFPPPSSQRSETSVELFGQLLFDHERCPERFRQLQLSLEALQRQLASPDRAPLSTIGVLQIGTLLERTPTFRIRSILAVGPPAQAATNLGTAAVHQCR
mgnify:CR=1 FL=1